MESTSPYFMPVKTENVMERPNAPTDTDVLSCTVKYNRPAQPVVPDKPDPKPYVPSTPSRPYTPATGTRTQSLRRPYTPNTSDGFHVGGWTGAMVGSLAAMAFALIEMKKRK